MKETFENDFTALRMITQMFIMKSWVEDPVFRRFELYLYDCHKKAWKIPNSIKNKEGAVEELVGKLLKRWRSFVFLHCYWGWNEDILHQSRMETTVNALVPLKFTKTEKFGQTQHSSWKMIATVFLGEKGVILVDFRELGSTIRANVSYRFV